MESASRAFYSLIQEFYDVWIRFHPEVVLRAGLPGYTGNLPAVSDDNVGALGSWLESTIVGMEEIDFHALDPAAQLDMELLFGACRDEYQSILECDWRHRDPPAFIPLGTIALLSLTADTEGYAALELCLKGVPKLLHQARSLLAGYPRLVPRIRIDEALLKGAATASLLRQLGSREDIPPKLQMLCEKASRAVEDYSAYLGKRISRHARGTAACGWQRFQEQLKLRHHLPDKLGDHLELARQVHQETLTELGTLSLQQTGSSDPRGWLQKLGCRSGLQAGGRLRYVQQRCDEIYRVLAGSGLFKLPDQAGLELRSLPEEYPVDYTTDYRAPAPGISGSAGMLYLAPPEDGRADTPEQLTAWCIRNAWPGRHMQAAVAAASPVAGTLVRRINLSASQQLGWSLYAEQLMQERVFSMLPEQKLHSLLERLRRSLMAVLDIELHVHGMAAAGALLQLQTLPGHSAEEATRDLLLLTRRPTRHLAGIVEWKLFEALRQWHSDRGEGDISDFHSRLLVQGSVATPLVIRRVFGQQAWEWVEARVYSQ